MDTVVRNAMAEMLCDLGLEILEKLNPAKFYDLLVVEWGLEDINEMWISDYYESQKQYNYLLNDTAEVLAIALTENNVNNLSPEQLSNFYVEYHVNGVYALITWEWGTDKFSEPHWVFVSKNTIPLETAMAKDLPLAIITATGWHEYKIRMYTADGVVYQQ